MYTNVLCSRTYFVEHIINIAYYYIDRSVLLENTPRVKFIRNYIRWRIFHILTGEDIDDVINRSFTVVCNCANSR